MAAPLIGLILSTGIFPIILAIFTIFGIFSRNKFFLAGALVIATYYVWQLNILPKGVIVILVFILILMIKSISKK